MRRQSFLSAAFMVLVATMPVGVSAVEPGATPAAGIEQVRGPVTNLPLPRYVSLKSNEANARRGPDQSHRIDWVYSRRDLPLRITAEFENWRRVEDAEGQGGWMHHALLSGARTVLVQTDMTPLHQRPDTTSPQTALLERGVIARMRACEHDWCRLEVEGARGWAKKRHLWGVESDEAFD
ncbi:MAG: aspartyl-trna synthetase [Roseinatronobacter sp.]|nr:aspartyl-trna synthetase [Roseinatronobacter sp.]